METRTLHLLFVCFFSSLLSVCVCYLILKKKKNVLSLFHREKKKRRKKVRSGKEKLLQNAPAVQLQPEQSIVYTSQPLPLKSSREQRLQITTLKKISHN